MVNQPADYTAYTIITRDGQDDFWLPIGAAFMHRDGDGCNIVLQAIPLGATIVLRRHTAGEQGPAISNPGNRPQARGRRRIRSSK